MGKRSPPTDRQVFPFTPKADPPVCHLPVGRQVDIVCGGKTPFSGARLS
ncbi:MAG: hypothetical protein ABH836_05300 [Candidatus Omnitrophota bacterium]